MSPSPVRILTDEEIAAIRERAAGASNWDGTFERRITLIRVSHLDVPALCATVEALRQLLTEKKNELAVAYGSGRSEPETEWFSALDRAKAEADTLRALAEELAAELATWEGAEAYMGGNGGRSTAALLTRCRAAGVLA